MRKETSNSLERNFQINQSNSLTNQRIEQKYNLSQRTQNKTNINYDEINSNILRQKTDISSHKFKLYPVLNEQQLQKNYYQNNQNQNLNEVSYNRLQLILRNIQYQIRCKILLKFNKIKNIQLQILKLKKSIGLSQKIIIFTIKQRRNIKGIRQFAGNVLTNFYFQNKWLKKLKSIFQAARALCRIQILIRPKREQWDIGISKKID